jgi:thiol-disulfide isomerase/thioredoxin
MSKPIIMIQKLAFSILIFLLSSTVFSQNNIEVHFPGAENRVAHVWAYTDYISYNRKEISTNNINAKGEFSFKLKLNNPKPVFIQVAFFRVQLFLEPNRDYVIEIDKVDFNNEDLYPSNVIAYLAPKYKIVSPTDHELNKGIFESEEMFSAFVDSNYLALIRGQNAKFLVDSFASELDSFISDYNNKYLKDYTALQMAQLRLLSHDYSTQMVVDKYFKGKALTLNDPSLMRFFNSFWSNYIVNKAKGFSPSGLDSAINIDKSYQVLSALLSRDPLLKDKVLRELVILRNIIQMYHSDRFDKSALIDILYDISRSKLRKEHQMIAVNVRKRLQSFDRGNKVPDFEFTDIHGDKFKLSDFEGMYVYINVWNMNCADCLPEMEYTKELYEEYDDIIKFISISVDADTATMASYVKSREYNWLCAPLGENFQFLNDYNIGVLPHYILIDKEGKLEMLNAPTPSDHFSDIFLKMLNDKRGNLKVKRQY